MSSSELLVVEGLSAAWGSAPVLDSVSFTLREGEFRVLMGPNGSGKTTLLRCLAGLERPTRGRVLLAGRDVTNVPVHDRRIGMVAQEPALFEHRTVFENLAYGLELQRARPDEIESRAEELARLLDLHQLLDRRAGELSGGERQRVALARTLAPRPKLVLLDEPFAAVDARRRAGLVADFRRVLHAQRTAALHVTHDREEGLLLGDRVMLLLDGRLRREGTPNAVHDTPGEVEVARFLGYNIVERDGKRWGVLPECLRVVPAGEGSLEAVVDLAGVAGRGPVIHLTAPDGSRLESRHPFHSALPAAGERVGLVWDQAVALADPPRVLPAGPSSAAKA